MSFFISIRVFFHGLQQPTGQQGKGGDHLSFHSTISTRSRTFKHLFATLHVRWLSHIFNRNACIYQTATRWDLPPYQIIFWLIDDVILIFICLLVGLILGFVAAIWLEKPVDSNSHQLSSLYYKRTDLASVLVTPRMTYFSKSIFLGEKVTHFFYLHLMYCFRMNEPKKWDQLTISFSIQKI